MSEQCYVDNLISERHEKISGLYHDIKEVNLLFEKVNELVQEQSDDVNKIKRHIDKSIDNTEDGLHSVKQAEKEADTSQKWMFAGLGIGAVTIAGAVVGAIFLL